MTTPPLQWTTSDILQHLDMLRAFASGPVRIEIRTGERGGLEAIETQRVADSYAAAPTLARIISRPEWQRYVTRNLPRPRARIEIDVNADRDVIGIRTVKRIRATYNRRKGGLIAPI